VKYADGSPIEPGDVVLLDGVDRGRVVASIDTAKHLPDHGGWAYLGEGIMVDTEFAGLVHYTTQTAGTISLVQRSEPLK